MLVKSTRSFSLALLGKLCLHWAYFIGLAEDVATILRCAKLVFMLFIISL